MEVRFGNIVFTSKFDSGNLDRVEKVEKNEQDQEKDRHYSSGVDIRLDLEFNVWTKQDCAGTEYENGNRSWFYFGVRGGNPGRLMKINIMNLNRQGKLYSQGYAPLVRTVPNKPKWDRIRDRPTFENIDGQFILSFSHRFIEGSKSAIVYFAFCFPWSYSEAQSQLALLDDQFKHCISLQPGCDANEIYYHHDVLCHSLDKLNIDLITISDCHGISSENEPRFDKNLFPDENIPRCKSFKSKRVYMVTSRVHPGETPASFVFNGFLEFILRPKDPRAISLRRNFVFKLIPILNPDGVQRGHYRTDARGVNLNRMYLDPDFKLYPSIYGAKSLLVYHHVENKIHHKKTDIPTGHGPKSNWTHIRNANTSCTSTPQSPTVHSPTHSTRCMHERSISLDTEPHSAEETEHYLTPLGHPTSTYVPSPVNEYLDTMCNQLNDIQVDSSKRVDIQSPFEANISAPHPSPSQSICAATSPRACPVNRPDLLVNQSPFSATSPMPYSANNINYEMSDDLPYDGIDMYSDCLNSPIQRDTISPYIGNEGSDDEHDDGDNNLQSTNTNAPHMSDTSLKMVGPNESGIAFYIDLHGHASKRGCFIYGNYFENEDIQVENMLFPKLISINTAHFDFLGCNFTERNMYLKDKREGLSKEGSGRVAIYKGLGITHSYTLECNYNTGRMVNCVPPAYGDNGRATPPPIAGFPPKYTQKHFEEVGRAMAIAGLDMFDINPWSRIVYCEHNSLHGVREAVRRYIRSLRGLPRTTNFNSLTNVKSSSSTTAASRNHCPFVPRVAFLTTRHHSSGQQEANSTSSCPNLKPTCSRRQPPLTGTTNTNARRELAPIRDGPRHALDRTQRRLSTSFMPSTMSPAATTSTPSIARSHMDNLHPQPSHQQSLSAPVTLSLSTTTNKRQEAHSIGQLDYQLLEKATKVSTVFRNRSQMKTSTDGCASHHPAKRISTLKNFQKTLAKYKEKSTMDQSEPSVNSLIRSMEEEKIEHLKNIPNLSMRQKPQLNHIVSAKVMDTPKSDPPKRRLWRSSPMKRRSSSHSPKSAKGTRRHGGSSTDSDIEKRGKARRRKSILKHMSKRQINETINNYDEVALKGAQRPLQNTGLVSPRITSRYTAVANQPSRTVKDKTGLSVREPAALHNSNAIASDAFTKPGLFVEQKTTTDKLLPTCSSLDVADNISP